MFGLKKGEVEDPTVIVFVVSVWEFIYSVPTLYPFLKVDSVSHGFPSKNPYPSSFRVRDFDLSTVGIRPFTLHRHRNTSEAKERHRDKRPKNECGVGSPPLLCHEGLHVEVLRDPFTSWVPQNLSNPSYPNKYKILHLT